MIRNSKIFFWLRQAFFLTILRIIANRFCSNNLNKLIVCNNENVCLKTDFTSKKCFTNHCMYNKCVCSFICKTQNNFVHGELFYSLCWRFLLIYSKLMYELYNSHVGLIWPTLCPLNPTHFNQFLLIFHESCSKVTSAIKWSLLKMYYLSHRLRIFLFHGKVMFRFQDIQVFVFLTISWFTKSVTSWWVLVYEIGCIFKYIFWTTTH